MGRRLRSLQSAGLRAFCKECCILFPATEAGAGVVVVVVVEGQKTRLY